jgi:S-adenosylmethionine:tRNA ribosyltransferase-isomerase
MRAEELEYELPEELIAQEPAPQREAARLLVMARHDAAFTHATIAALPALAAPALFVFNDTRVLPARLVGSKPSGGRFELLLVERVGAAGVQEQWLCMARPLKSMRPGLELSVAEPHGATRLAIAIGERVGEALLAVTLRAEGGVEQALEAVGELPLPPYIARKPEPSDRERYQTVFAREPGAIAAPTAGLHFGEQLLAALAAAGHERAHVTLHVGPGTFAPLNAADLRDHAMHSERYIISAETAAAVQRAKQAKRPVIAVGTTVVRTLEACAREHGQVVAARGSTALCIYPPYEFQVVDGLLTNFHLPRSTLLALVMAFAGVDAVRAAYREAVRERYRFFSYGDAMFIQPNRSPC